RVSIAISPPSNSPRCLVASHWRASQRGRALATEQKPYSAISGREERKLRVQRYVRAALAGLRSGRPSTPTKRAAIGPKGGCADEFFRERRDCSAPLPESSRIPPPTDPDR